MTFNTGTVAISIWYHSFRLLYLLLLYYRIQSTVLLVKVLMLNPRWVFVKERLKA